MILTDLVDDEMNFFEIRVLATGTVSRVGKHGDFWLVVGVFITFFEGAVVTLIGWMLILSGVIGIIGDVMFIQNVNSLVDKLTGKTA